MIEHFCVGCFSSGYEAAIDMLQNAITVVLQFGRDPWLCDSDEPQHGRFTRQVAVHRNSVQLSFFQGWYRTPGFAKVARHRLIRIGEEFAFFKG